MKKLFTGLSFIAIAVFVACDGSGTNANSELLGNSSNSSSESFDEYDGEVEYVEDLPKCTAKKDEKVYYVEDEDIAYTCRYDEDEEAGEWINASEGSDGSSSSDEADEGKSSASEEPESSGSEGVEGSDGSSSSDEGKSSASEEPESSSSEGVEGSSASVSGEMVSCDIPGVMGECMEYPVGSDEAAQMTEFCVSMLGGTLGTGCAASTRDSSVYDAMANTLTDLRDGQTYNTVTIGTQTWMAENLNYAYTGVPFDNGYYTSDSTSWCYGDDPANCAKYGRLYTWAAAMDSVGTWSTSGKGCGYGKTCSVASAGSVTLVRGICPKGWHLPSHDEWEALFTAVGGSSTAGSKLKSQTGWTAYSGITNEDAFGFSALPAGGRYRKGNFDYDGYYANFWSSTEDDSYSAYFMRLYYDYDNGYLYDYYKYFGFSVRCLRD